MALTAGQSNCEGHFDPAGRATGERFGPIRKPCAPSVRADRSLPFQPLERIDDGVEQFVRDVADMKLIQIDIIGREAP